VQKCPTGTVPLYINNTCFSFYESVTDKCKGNRVNKPLCECPSGYYSDGGEICKPCDSPCK